jgi:hypothetical protein
MEGRRKEGKWTCRPERECVKGEKRENEHEAFFLVLGSSIFKAPMRNIVRDNVINPTSRIFDWDWEGVKWWRHGSNSGPLLWYYVKSPLILRI